MVCGGRDFGSADRAHRALNRLHERHGFSVVVHGAASGADTIAKQWAESVGIRDEPYPANWSDLSQPGAVVRTNRGGRQYDARAGSRRNQRMLDEGRPDLVVAFPGGNGTADMVKRARAAGLRVIRMVPASPASL